MGVVQRLGDRLLGCFVPKVEAAAFWHWEIFCDSTYCIMDDGNGGIVTGNQQKIQCWCHDGSGYCTDCSIIACKC